MLRCLIIALKYQRNNKVKNLAYHITYNSELCHPICPLIIMSKLGRGYIWSRYTQELSKARTAIAKVSLKGMSI